MGAPGGLGPAEGGDPGLAGGEQAAAQRRIALERQQREQAERERADRERLDRERAKAVREPLHLSTPKRVTVTADNLTAVLDELRADVEAGGGKAIEVTWQFFSSTSR